MEVHHARNKGECYFCKKRGHHIKDCMKMLKQPFGVNEAQVKRPTRRDKINCYNCGQLGHYANECAKYRKQSLNSEPFQM